ncbi:MAG: TonB-dependent receptor [Bacteroidales bacterium]|nr:TonB-dependent receptor [Bacteroidales bacterium]
MYSKIGSALVLAFCLASGLSAREVGGRIVDASNAPIQGANVWWLDAKTGTTTDAQGHFRIPFSRETDRLKISYVGYQTDTLSATLFNETNDVQIALNEAVYLEEVQIAGRRPGLVASRITTLKVETITQDELCKAACCNLSESFETNPSVDVSYSDAATGAKQIKLLGLSGTYVQMLSEGIPFIRGLASPYGLSHVPGPWMESIQVSKGAASVINGYEAITGQINVEYKKPMTSDLLSVNLFMADNLRSEVNADWALKLNPYTSTSTFVHYENETREHDANGDGFMDLPAVEQASLLHRWYYNKNGYTSQFAIKGLDETRQSGQTRHGNHAGTSTDPLYRIDLATQRIEAFAKNGYVFNPERNRSVGLITSVS